MCRHLARFCHFSSLGRDARETKESRLSVPDNGCNFICNFLLWWPYWKFFVIEISIVNSNSSINAWKWVIVKIPTTIRNHTWIVAYVHDRIYLELYMFVKLFMDINVLARIEFSSMAPNEEFGKKCKATPQLKDISTNPTILRLPIHETASKVGNRFVIAKSPTPQFLIHEWVLVKDGLHWYHKQKISDESSLYSNLGSTLL